jgi:hypothetical protein
VTYNIGSIAAEAYNRLPSGTVPSWLSGNNLITLASGACIDVGNMVGTSVGAPAIDEKYQNILVNLTTLYAQGAIEGINSSWSAGGMSIGKGASPYMTFLEGQVQRSLEGINHKVNYYKVQL